MGNEQSVEGQAMPESGLRLSTLCRYQTESGIEEGTFSWFQASTDVSGLVLRGAHRWGYVLSHMGGQRLFKDQRQRFFVLLDHYMCYFDSHSPEARMKGSIDLDKTHCNFELLPRPPESADILLQGSSGGGGGEGEEHRVEVTRRNGEFSMVLCFSCATSLSDWMMSIFDVQQRKATFSPLGHGFGGGGGVNDDGDSDDSSGLPTSLPSSSSGRSSGGNNRGGGIASTIYNNFAPRTQSRPRGGGGGGRRWGRRRGTLDSPPERRPSRPLQTRRGGNGVPSSWADGDIGVTTTEEEQGGGETGGERSPPEDPSRPSPSSRRPPATTTSAASTSSVWLGKASERLQGLPRGGRAAGNSCGIGVHPGGGGGGGGGGDGSNTDEYGAFTTAQASIYEGWTRGLQPHGWGRMVFANGDCVEGWWEHDVLQGSGEHTSRHEGWTYRGGYVRGERHGPGRLVTAQSDVWECEWSHGVVAHASRGTHATAAGEVYHGGCGPSREDPAVPCRAGQGRLRRRDGEQVDTRFRAGRAVDGAKGVVRFGNGAIFFGELEEARPHGYGELYLSSVKASRANSSCNYSSSSSSSKRRRRKGTGSLAKLDEMARDVLWYKGDFRLGKPHGSGLVKYKEPASARRGTAVPGGKGGGEGEAGVPTGAEGWGESKEEDKERLEAKGEEGVDGEGRCGGGCSSEDEERGEPLALDVPATDEAIILEEDDEEDGDSTSESDDDEEEEEDETEEEEGRQRREGRTSRRQQRRNIDGRQARPEDGEEEKATPGLMRMGRRGPPPESGSGSNSNSSSGGGGEADMEYEATFVDGVMVRYDASRLRLAALRVGRAEIRRLETLLQKEEDAMSRLRVRGLCLLCNAEEMNALLVGCRHRVLCVGCAERTERCPVCSERIGKVVKTYKT